MVTVLLSAIIAANLSIAPATAQSDTTNKYYINGELVENFDGSQIVGHKITAYRIEDIHTRKQVVKLHRISTEITEPRYMYILNNKGVSKAMADSVMNSDNVGSIKVYKGAGRSSLIIIKTKDQEKKEEDFKRSFQDRITEYQGMLKQEGRRKIPNYPDISGRTP